MMNRRAVLTLSLLVWMLWAAVGAALAQDTVTPTPVPLSDQDLASLATQTYLNAERAADAADEAQQHFQNASTQVQISLDTANDLLGLFQNVGTVVALMVPILAVLYAITVNRRLESALDKIDEQAREFTEIKRLAADMRDNIRSQQQQSARFEVVSGEMLETKRSIEKSTIQIEGAVEGVRAEWERARAELTAINQRLERQIGDTQSHLQALIVEQRENAARVNLALSFQSLGERQYRFGDFTGALDYYRQALNLDPNSPIVHYRLGYVYTHSSQLAEAEHHLARALEIEKDFPPALAALGYVYRRMAEKLPTGFERDEKFSRAENLLLRALADSPKLVDDDGESWWGSLGGLYRRRSQTDEAIQAYERAAEVTPQSSYAYSNLALLYMKKNDHARMLKTYHRVEKLASAEVQAEVENYWAYADLLTARLALGQVKPSEEALHALLGVVPKEATYVFETLLNTLHHLEETLGQDGAGHIRDAIETIERRQAELAGLRFDGEPDTVAELPAPAPDVTG